MSYTIADIKEDLSAVIHGTTLNKVRSVDLLIDRAARKLLEDLDPAETKRIAQITNAIYDRVYDYPIPADVKGDRVIDIRPQVNRQFFDYFFQTYNEVFDYTKATIQNAGEFTIQWNTGFKSLRIAKNLIAGLLVNAASTINDNGTWAVGGTASNLQVDNINYVYGGGSLRFDADAGANPSVAYLENTTMTPIDLDRDLLQGSEFLYVYIPDTSVVTNFKYRWGSSTSDYWEQTVTSAYNITAFQTGWNLLRFDWRTATVVGSPDSSDVTYARFSVTYNGTATPNFRLNNIVSQLGTIYEIEYYSKFIFRDGTTGVFQENVTDDSNIINLDTDSYNVLFHCVAYYAAQQIQGSDGKFDISFFLKEYTDSLERYRAKYKSEVIKPSQSYYSMPPKGPRTRIRWSSS